MKTILFALSIITFSVLGQTSDFRINQIYKDLAAVRQNPCAMAHLYDYDICVFEATEKVLKYDKKLAKECQDYAEYLYQRSKKRKLKGDLIHSPSYVICNESLAWLNDGQDAIKAWIEEKEYDGDGHRLHIMNVKECHKSDTIIGIGIRFDPENIMWYVVLRTK